MAQSILLQRWVVIVVQVVQVHNFNGSLTFQEAKHQIGADKTDRSGDEEGLHLFWARRLGFPQLRSVSHNLW